MNFTYTSSNVPSAEYTTVDFPILHSPCGCNGICLPPNCSCQSSSANYTVDGKLNQLGVVDKPPIFECHSNCHCDPTVCGNRVVQSGILTPLDVISCGPKGFGLKSLQKIPRGSFVCEYAGELLDETEAKRRIGAKSERNRLSGTSEPNYLIIVNERFDVDHTVKTYVDAEFLGNLGRFANHSCQPNCAMIPVRIGSAEPHLALFAVKDIDVDDEITYDYGNAAGSVQPANIEELRQSNNVKCLCQSPNCTGFLPFEYSEVQ